MRSKKFLLAVFASVASLLAGQPVESPAVPPAGEFQAPDPALAPVTDPAYRLVLGDRISVTIFGEGDLGAQQMIDRGGLVRLPLVGEVSVAGRSVRQAEKLIEDRYRRDEILKAPQVTLNVIGYAPREVTLLGAVRAPGTFQFPPNALSMDIRDVIARQGGFTPVAKGDAVAVTRRQRDGRETTTVVDVDRMMFSRSRNKETPDVFLIYPGDRIFVPERLF